MPEMKEEKFKPRKSQICLLFRLNIDSKRVWCKLYCREKLFILFFPWIHGFRCNKNWRPWIDIQCSLFVHLVASNGATNLPPHFIYVSPHLSNKKPPASQSHSPLLSFFRCCMISHPILLLSLYFNSFSPFFFPPPLPPTNPLPVAHRNSVNGVLCWNSLDCLPHWIVTRSRFSSAWGSKARGRRPVQPAKDLPGVFYLQKKKKIIQENNANTHLKNAFHVHDRYFSMKFSSTWTCFIILKEFQFVVFFFFLLPIFMVNLISCGFEFMVYLFIYLFMGNSIEK